MYLGTLRNTAIFDKLIETDKKVLDLIKEKEKEAIEKEKLKEKYKDLNIKDNNDNSIELTKNEQNEIIKEQVAKLRKYIETEEWKKNDKKTIYKKYLNVNTINSYRTFNVKEKKTQVKIN